MFGVLLKSIKQRLAICGFLFDKYNIVLLVVALAIAFLNTFSAPELFIAVTVLQVLFSKTNKQD